MCPRMPSPENRQTLRIAIVADFDHGKHSHWATEAALFHAAANLDMRVEPCWLDSTSLEHEPQLRDLANYAGIWGAPGSPFQSALGVLRAIERARRMGLPFLGTCAGFQYALIEWTRNVLGIPNADSADNVTHASDAVITPVQCSGPAQTGPRLTGPGCARVVPGTLLSELCGAIDLRGEYFCSYEVNPSFVPRWQTAGLRIAATGADGELRAFELPANRFFVATLFQPQLSSRYTQPHPIVLGFLRACAQRL